MQGQKYQWGELIGAKLKTPASHQIPNPPTAPQYSINNSKTLKLKLEQGKM